MSGTGWPGLRGQRYCTRRAISATTTVLEAVFLKIFPSTTLHLVILLSLIQRFGALFCSFKQLHHLLYLINVKFKPEKVLWREFNLTNLSILYERESFLKQRELLRIEDSLIIRARLHDPVSGCNIKKYYYSSSSPPTPPPQQFIRFYGSRFASIHLYRWVERDHVEESFLSKQHDVRDQYWSNQPSHPDQKFVLLCPQSCLNFNTLFNAARLARVARVSFSGRTL